MCDAVRGYLPDAASISPGTLNGILSAGGPLDSLGNVYDGAALSVTVALGIRAAPAEGDPAFHGYFNIASYQAQESSGAITASLQFDQRSPILVQNHVNPWGVLLHANSAVTAVNSAAGIDDRGAATALGGYMVYHVLAGDGTATIKVQDAAVNNDGGFADLSGATTGVIACDAVSSGIVALGIGATVRRYLRWQVVLGTANTVTFVLSFTRS